jgi:uncharacterized protein (TIGR03437 family)
MQIYRFARSVRGLKRTVVFCVSAVASFYLADPCRAQAAPSYTINTFAGIGVSGYAGDGSQASNAQLANPFGIAVDSAGNIYIADQANNRIRKITPDGTINTVAGNGTAGYTGDKGSATNAELASPQGVAVDASGNIYISDTINNVVRKVSGGTITTIAGNNSLGFGYSGDGGPAIGAQLFNPTGLAVDSSGNLYIADTNNSVIRRVGTDNNINTVAGNHAPGYLGDSGQATAAEIDSPTGVAVGSNGILYIADTGNNRVRKVGLDGTISSVAGSFIGAYGGDGGPAIKASLNRPRGVAVDAAGNLYIADAFNGRIRMVTTNAAIATIAGNGGAGFSGDGGQATSAKLYFPSDVALDSSGNVYIVDNQNNRIRILTPVQQIPSIAAGGVQSAGAFGAFSAVAPGSWIEIFGTNLATHTRTWTGDDFNGASAPTALDGTFVTIGGESAYVDFISPTQVNAQVPSTVGTGPQSIVVTTAQGMSSPFSLTVNSTQPGLLAPPSFNVVGNQYAVALFSDGVTFVAPSGAIPGVASRQATPGDTIVLYGIGFGAVTPFTPAGEIAGPGTTLTLPLQVFFGQTPAVLSYWGLAPGSVGLYQINVVVPNVATSDLVPLTLTLGSQSGTQTLFIAVKN